MQITRLFVPYRTNATAIIIIIVVVTELNIAHCLLTFSSHLSEDGDNNVYHKPQSNYLLYICDAMATHKQFRLSLRRVVGIGPKYSQMSFARSLNLYL